MSSLNFIHESFAPTNGKGFSLSNATGTATPSSFEFVTFTNPDSMRAAQAKSQIRKHAMRDIGVLRRRPNKRRKGYVSMPMDFRPETVAPHPATLSISYEGVDPFLPYPIELDHDAKRLVANMFGHSQRAFREHWFPVALTAAPIFNQALANSALQFESMGVVHTLDRSAMSYHQLTLTSIRTQLDEVQGNVTVELVASVCAVISWNAIREATEACEVQLQGMMTLVDAYEGGLEALASKEELRSTMSWVELRGVFMLDIPPRLSLPHSWIEELNTLPKSGYIGGSLYLVDPVVEQHWPRNHPAQISTLGLYQELVCYSQQVAADVANSSIDHTILKLPIWTNIVIFKLLTLRPLEDPDTNILTQAVFAAEAVRLAMLLYMAPVWRFYGTLPTHSRIMVHKLQHNLQNEMGRRAWCPALRRLHIWVLYMGALEAEGLGEQDVKAGFVDMLAEFVAVNEDALQIARSVLWVPGLVEDQATSLQEDIEHIQALRGHNVSESSWPS